MSADDRPDLSFIIPVYNASRTIASVVDEIRSVCRALRFEIVLINDGSTDDSESVCRQLAEQHPETIVFLQLARNFGEHNAVLAGLPQARGNYVTVLDDDGQHPPTEALRLYEAIRQRGDDVVYGHYITKQHGRLRNLGSWLHNKLATRMLGKPHGLYLSSFKIMNRFVVDVLAHQPHAPPYVDGLIFQTTQRVSQIDVSHRKRLEGESNYSLRKLVTTWLGIFLSFSVLPLRAAGILGFTCALLTGPLLVLIVINKIWIDPELTFGIPTVLCTIVFFAGVQLLILGVFGEYLGRSFATRPDRPQFVVRYVCRKE